MFRRLSVSPSSPPLMLVLPSALRRVDPYKPNRLIWLRGCYTTKRMNREIWAAWQEMCSFNNKALLFHNESPGVLRHDLVDDQPEARVILRTGREPLDLFVDRREPRAQELDLTRRDVDNEGLEGAKRATARSVPI